MPGRDRTGPMGKGSMTGRGAGYCTGNEFPRRYAGRGRGAGNMRIGVSGRPAGRGMGCRGGFRFSTVSIANPYTYEEVPGSNANDNERVESMEARIQSLEQQKETLKKEIEDLRESRTTNE
ncbi:MAG: DUF5320 domain-containing protein [Methanosarcinaceae archaeon]|nr:DUF5320 domain-containing protein [Methanosarcinaceae archaeon]